MTTDSDDGEQMPLLEASVWKPQVGLIGKAALTTVPCHELVEGCFNVVKTNLAASEQMLQPVRKGLKESNLPILTEFQEDLSFEQFHVVIRLENRILFRKMFPYKKLFIYT